MVVENCFIIELGGWNFGKHTTIVHSEKNDGLARSLPLFWMHPNAQSNKMYWKKTRLNKSNKQWNLESGQTWSMDKVSGHYTK